MLGPSPSEAPSRGGRHAGECAEERWKKGHQEQRVRRQVAQKRKGTKGALGQHAVQGGGGEAAGWEGERKRKKIKRRTEAIVLGRDFYGVFWNVPPVRLEPAVFG